jgi:hypothetical protein
MGEILSDSPLLVLTNAQEGIGMKSISIGSGIFSLGFWFFLFLW